LKSNSNPPQAFRKFALGLSAGPAYLVNEQEFAAALHAHFLITLGESRFAQGLGYEDGLGRSVRRFATRRINFLKSVATAIVGVSEQKWAEDSSRGNASWVNFRKTQAHYAR
jgi:hypothetical protein